MKTFCIIYNEMYLKMCRSKKRKDHWANKIAEHKLTCPECQSRDLQLKSQKSIMSA